jgi:beta-lactamase superfamily II metal-dependent hydrolase
MTWIEFIRNITSEYWGSFRFGLLFIVAAVAIFVLEKDRIKRYSFLWYSLIGIIIIYNPLTLFILQLFIEKNLFNDYYMRLFSLIPIMPIIAYGLTLLVTRFEGKKRLVATLASLAVIALLGKCIYAQDWYTKAENRNKVPQDVITICDLFADYQGDLIKIMAPQKANVFLRQMDSRFSMPYGRAVPDEALELTAENPDVLAVANYANEKDVDYIVVWAADDTLNAFLNYGYKLYGRTENYAVLENVRPTWLMTEYPMSSGEQGIFYTIENPTTGTLIVIDGGDAANEQLVREVINAKGGAVDAWIITHYHQDHVDAFNAIYADPKGITIKQVYATPLDEDTFNQVAQEWDDVKSFQKFQKLAKTSTNINYVKRDDVLTYNDLTITFFNAFDEVVKDFAYDIPNNDSLVFKIETPNRSALILADCHNDFMAEYFMKEYGEKLQADILQCAHHGNNSIPEDTGFYELVNPQVAIFDTPTKIMTSPQYTAGALAAYLANMGVRITWYKSAPNVFGL